MGKFGNSIGHAYVRGKDMIEEGEPIMFSISLKDKSKKVIQFRLYF